MADFEFSDTATVTIPLSDYEKLKETINNLEKKLEESEKTHQQAYEYIIRPMTVEWIRRDFPLKRFDLTSATVAADLDIGRGKLVYKIEIPV